MTVDKDWFVSWFDTHYYHMLYQHRDDNEANAFIRRIVEEIKLPEQSKVLDLACGKGRHAQALANLGMKTLGIDLSPSSIEKAKCFENESLRFKVADMRYPVADEEFDAVFSLFSSFGYFKDDRENFMVIESVSQMLLKGSFFIFDYLNVLPFVEKTENQQEKEIDNVLFVTQKMVTNDAIIKKIRVLDKDRNLSFEEYLKKYDLTQFEDWFQQTGLQLKHVFGDYNLNGFEPSNSPRLIMVATKF